MLLLGICIMSNQISGQNDISMVITNNSSNSFEEDYLFVLSSNTEVDSKLHTAKIEDAAILEAKYDSQVSEDFGTYLNPISNTLKMKVKKKVTYNKVQLTNTDTGKVVINKKIDEDQSVVDLTSLNPGNYIMILTDDENNIYSEQFSLY